jgi:FkbM family methyltransferase
MMRVRSVLQQTLPPILFGQAVELYTRFQAMKSGVRVKWGDEFIDIIDAPRIIRIHRRHQIYTLDIISHFEYYFSAVRSVQYGKFHLVDYSVPKYHEAIGFDLHPIMFPSFAEPLATTQQYMEFAALGNDMTVLDLGAYSGLTSIIFQEAVGAGGRVVAVEADEQNLDCIDRNFALYAKIRRVRIGLLRGAVWDHEDGLEFLTDGNMGASASSIVGKVNRGAVRSVRSFTLSSIADQLALDRIDFIKCDVEGAETVVFNDRPFFDRFTPRMIIETHLVHGQPTVEKCVSDLTSIGYECRQVPQVGGATTPLLECSPRRD